MNKVKSIDIYEVTPIIKEMINEGRDVKLTVVGNSMFPMLHNKQDSVVLTKPKDPLKKYDLPLFQRKTGEYVLHRIIKVGDGVLIINGDNQYMEEQIYPDMIIGIVKEFYRKGKKISCNSKMYKLYCRFWVVFKPLRGLIVKVYSNTIGNLKRS